MAKATRLSPLAAIVLALLAAACTAAPGTGAWQATPWVDDALVNNLTAQGQIPVSNPPWGY